MGQWFDKKMFILDLTSPREYAIILQMGRRNECIEIFYGDKDGGYIALIPELAGCSAFGKTEGAALKEVMTAMELNTYFKVVFFIHNISLNKCIEKIKTGFINHYSTCY